MSFRVAIASGKGGTGKTTVSIALFLSFIQNEISVVYIDADVEEPNAHLFLNPDFSTTKKVQLPVPVVVAEKCTGCGRCADFCRFNAMGMLRQTPILFPELCHQCGGCVLQCDFDAIKKTLYTIGVVNEGVAKGMSFANGVLNIGETRAVPVIDAVRDTGNALVQIIDSPPGTACPAMAAVRGVNHVVLVTESTPFGLHDLKLAVHTFLEMGADMSVIINKSGSYDENIVTFCKEYNLTVLSRIPDACHIAKAYAAGGIHEDVMKGLEPVVAYLQNLIQQGAFV